MTPNIQTALKRLSAVGFVGADVYLAELIPVVEMAWADGEIQPNEKALLEAYCQTLVESLNKQAGARLFSLGHCLELLERLSTQRLDPARRQSALDALTTLLRHSPRALEVKHRVIEWAEAVAAVDGRPVWDARELFWLQTIRRTLQCPE